MQIIRDKEYLNALADISVYIAKDSFKSADIFIDDLDKMIDNLQNFPYKFRQSFYHDTYEIRDMVFKGYTIPYLIDKKNNTIVILDIFKWTDR